jgi:hypothetical protein
MNRGEAFNKSRVKFEEQFSCPTRKFIWQEIASDIGYLSLRVECISDPLFQEEVRGYLQKLNNNATILMMMETEKIKPEQEKE